MPPRPFLRAVAEQAGILPSYVDQSGRIQHTPDRTRVALLAAMGIDAGSEAAARTALDVARARRVDTPLAAVRIAGAQAARRLALGLHAQSWLAEVACEDGAIVRLEGRGDRRAIMLPPLAPGYHRLRVALSSGGRERIGEQTLIVTPSRCPTPSRRLGGRRIYGILANLYSVRSGRNWGYGNLTDLRHVLDWAADVGAAFVGINPLHALDNRGDQISPYSPVSRLYRNVLYLDPTATPEWTALSPAQRRRLAPAEALQRLRSSDRVDSAAVRALARPVFAALHGLFAARHRDRSTARGRAYAGYLAGEGEALIDFATFLALQDHFGPRGRRRWQDWPAAFRDPRTPAVRAFRAAQRTEVDRHCYLQFELDRQLGVVAARARQRGLPIGVYQDLALGSSRRGSDPWSFPGLFFDRVDIGAPPDAYSPTGQNWRLPAIDPRGLAARGYDYWIRLLRAALRHAGALRIDHVMGLFRQYWIPAGASAAQGAYVCFPAHDLLGILALEAARAGALVIGEDLGTVPRGLRAMLARWTVLSTRVLYFERTRRGGFRAARTYPRQALVGANTHDLVPLAGFWQGRDLALRRQLGLLRDDRALAAAQTARAGERRALVRRLRAEGLLAAGSGEPDGVALGAAVHAFVARTPAVLAAVSLDDLTGEETPINQPGVSLARYPSWSRRMRAAIESLPTDPEVARALDGLPSGPRRWKPRADGAHGGGRRRV